MDENKIQDHIRCRKLTVVNSNDKAGFEVSNRDDAIRIEVTDTSGNKRLIIHLDEKDAAIIVPDAKTNGGILIATNSDKNLVSVTNDDTIAIMEVNEDGAFIRHD